MEYTNESSSSSNYKIKDLRIYSSTEWMAENRKKYRQVFDRFETTYVYAELSLFNKLYDFEDWEAQIEFKCYAIKKGRVEICELSFTRKVSKFDPIFYIREGWGNKREGSFWKKGTYCWEAFVDGDKVSTRFFYIEDAGAPITLEHNPYLTVNTVHLYEGPYEDMPEDERTYCNVFDAEETRYIYAELILENRNINKSWQLEVFVKFFNDAQELKGQVVRLARADRKDEIIKISAGWGHNMKGSWRKEKYKAVVVFLDRTLVVVPFEVGDSYEIGEPDLQFPNAEAKGSMLPSLNRVGFEEVMNKLDGLIGLSNIKQQIRDHSDYIRFLQIRKERGFKELDVINVHSVFLGNPGTGKTTVAQMMGFLYNKMGLLSRGHVHEVDRVELVGEYIGQTAPKVRAAIDKARGGVLFIDEAYALARNNDDTKDFGREVIEILVKEMSNGVGDLAVIVAGYPKEMKYFLDSNPGLKSRFKYFYNFKDYTPDELVSIANFAAEIKELTFDLDAHEALEKIIINAYRNRDTTFGNARFVFDIIDQAKIALGLRLMRDFEAQLVPAGEHFRALSRDKMERIELVDVQKVNPTLPKTKPRIPIDQELLDITLKELNDLIGMDNIKAQVNEMVQLVRYKQQIRADVLHSFSLHTVLLGNPGTGKTTVARILARLYKALGLLERGHLVETDRQGMVAAFVGHTAIKTNERVEEAKNGVLFIDEAYALTPGGMSASRDFGDEAIQTLLKRMEDQRGEFFLFVAGYTDKMEAFLKANPGFTSRFDQTLRFEDYTAAQLMEIAMFMFTEQAFVLTEETSESLRNYLKFIHEYRDNYFGNARVVRTIVADIIKKQSLRLAASLEQEIEIEDTKTIQMADVLHLTTDKDQFNFGRKGIRFS